MQTQSDSASVTGLVLAAGSGTRAGGPKALRRTEDGEAWLARAVRTLRAGGCSRVVVILGASADQARSLVPHDAEALIADDWAEGMSASLRKGIAAADGDAVIVSLVDLPGLPANAVARMAERADVAALCRATYGGRPGHPVLIGRHHWEQLARSLSGDVGAGAYLAANGVEEIECSDLWDGRDVDTSPGGRG